jgi:hypothetical protein
VLQELMAGGGKAAFAAGADRLRAIHIQNYNHYVAPEAGGPQKEVGMVMLVAVILYTARQPSRICQGNGGGGRIVFSTSATTYLQRRMGVQWWWWW